MGCVLGCQTGCLSPGGFARLVGERMGRTRSMRYHRSHYLEDDYLKSHQVLGRGFSGAVVQGSNRKTQEKVAIKTLSVNLTDLMEGEKVIKHMAREVDLLLSVSHPNVVRLLDVYEKPASLTIVMELLEGGTLQSYLLEQERMDEQEAASTASQMFQAINYLHHHLIIHRDLKPDNFMFQGPGFGDGDLKLIDFGFCKHFIPGKLMKSCKGTLSYMAPEVLQQQYTFTCDIWSLGVIVFRCLSGYLPFQDQGFAAHPLLARNFEDRIKSRILHGKVLVQDKDAWKELSPEARQFVKSLLSVAPAARPTALSALDHPWLQRRLRRSSSYLPNTASRLPLRLREPPAPGCFSRACLMLLVWLKCHPGVDEATVTVAREDVDGVHGFAFVRSGAFLSALKAPERAPEPCQKVFGILQGCGAWTDVLEALRPFEDELTGQLLTQAFGILDHDSKGFVTLPDVEDVFAGGGWNVAEMFSEVTGAGDGVITYGQFREHLCAEPIS